MLLHRPAFPSVLSLALQQKCPSSICKTIRLGCSIELWHFSCPPSTWCQRRTAPPVGSLHREHRGAAGSCGMGVVCTLDLDYSSLLIFGKGWVLFLPEWACSILSGCEVLRICPFLDFFCDSLRGTSWKLQNFRDCANPPSFLPWD